MLLHWHVDRGADQRALRRLGVSEADRDELRGHVDHIVHLAALYDLTADPSECHDLAATHPEKLDELRVRWWTEAERYGEMGLEFPKGE